MPTFVYIGRDGPRGAELRAGPVRDRHLAAIEKLDAQGRIHFAGPLRDGLITLVDGRIGIRGAVLFDSSKAELRSEGHALIRQLVGPLSSYLGTRDVALMVSGFTDDQPMRGNNRHHDHGSPVSWNAADAVLVNHQRPVPG